MITSYPTRSNGIIVLVNSQIGFFCRRFLFQQFYKAVKTRISVVIEINTVKGCQGVILALNCDHIRLQEQTCNVRSGVVSIVFSNMSKFAMVDRFRFAIAAFS